MSIEGVRVLCQLQLIDNVLNVTGVRYIMTTHFDYDILRTIFKNVIYYN